MHLIYRNVNEAMRALPSVVATHGIPEQTRNGLAFVLPTPVILETTHPCERTHLLAARKSNALLFLLDGLSILSNIDYVVPFSDIVPRFRNYSDDGVHLRGHYGRRLYSQIPTAIDMLRIDPTSRRNTLQIWDHTEDHGAMSVDIPCNVHVNLRGHEATNTLDISVFNRSNDIWWGMLGANIVQFSFLLEFLALSAGMRVGRLFQISTNAHIYADFGPAKLQLAETVHQPSPTPLDVHNLRPLLNELFETLSVGSKWRGIVDKRYEENRFLSDVVIPMIRAHYTDDASVLSDYPDNDWFMSMRINKNWSL